jgi:hypothetical protein
LAAKKDIFITFLAWLKPNSHSLQRDMQAGASAGMKSGLLFAVKRPQKANCHEYKFIATLVEALAFV